MNEQANYNVVWLLSIISGQFPPWGQYYGCCQLTSCKYNYLRTNGINSIWCVKGLVRQSRFDESRLQHLAIIWSTSSPVLACWIARGVTCQDPFIQVPLSSLFAFANHRSARNIFFINSIYISFHFLSQYE